MPGKDNTSQYEVKEEKFKLLGRSVEISQKGGLVALTIDAETHAVRFLKNGRPFTNAYVNAMATSVRDYAERFVKFTEAQNKHWAKIAKERKKQQDVCP
ncbi:MAG: hypothetical protein KTR18_06970 [Acidiferrobacterales bacterium]|nr:hypothetical protein [Acidiferrobacterales bacterium]